MQLHFPSLFRSLLIAGMMAIPIYVGLQQEGGLAGIVSSEHTGYPVFYTLFLVLLPPFGLALAMFIYYFTQGVGWMPPRVFWMAYGAFFALCFVLFVAARIIGFG